jgi:hypothetical protein
MSGHLLNLPVVLHTGLGVRVMVTFLTMLTSGFSIIECIWFAIAWTPKVITSSSYLVRLASCTAKPTCEMACWKGSNLLITTVDAVKIA